MQSSNGLGDAKGCSLRCGRQCKFPKLNPIAERDYRMPSSATTNTSDATAMMTVAITPGWRRLSIVMMLLALIAARWLAYANAGGLWRDEVHSVTMATFPAGDLFFALTHDSFPVLWQVLLRGWISLFGSTDAALRVLGLLTGLAVIPALWWMTRQFKLSFPWWSMLLLGLDPTLIIFGGEVRGYSLGIVTLLVLIGVSWNTLNQPTVWRWAGLMVAALLAVHSSYTNCFLLAATFIGCGVVALYRGRYFVCLGFAVIGILTAVTMLPYALYVFPRMADVLKPIQAPSSWRSRLNVFLRTLRSGGLMRGLVWCVVGVVATREVYRRVLSKDSAQPSQSQSDQNILIFMITFFWVGTCGFWLYLNFLDVHTQSWYYLPYLTLLAVTTDVGMQLWFQHQPERKPRAFRLAAIAAVLVCAETGFYLPHRLTAVDLVARDLAGKVQEGDLILVTPWYVGISFDRYYHGPTSWISIPNVDHDHRYNGYRELFERVMPLPPEMGIQSELKQIDDVLRAGGSVWWVGEKPKLRPGEEPLQLSGAPDPKYGWKESAYLTAWQELTIARMQAIGVTVSEHPIQRPRLINSHENPPVFRFQSNRPEFKLSASQ